jgi:hypothetical protein
VSFIASLGRFAEGRKINRQLFFQRFRPSVEEIRSWAKSFDKLMRSSGEFWWGFEILMNLGGALRAEM